MQSVTFEFIIKSQLIFFDSKSLVSMLKYMEDIKTNIETRMYVCINTAVLLLLTNPFWSLRTWGHCIKADDPAIEKQMR